MTDTETKPKYRFGSTQFIVNIAFGVLYLVLAVFVLTIATTAPCPRGYSPEQGRRNQLWFSECSESIRFTSTGRSNRREWE
ncbi:hypothetical protein ABIE52_000076 [Rhodococcus sp. OAS809]